MPRGYDRSLYILPFDHRSSFQSKIFGWESRFSDAQTAEIAGARQVVYDGFLAAAWRSKQAMRDQTAAEIARRYRQFADLSERRDSSLSSVASSSVRPDHRAYNGHGALESCSSE